MRRAWPTVLLVACAAIPNKPAATQHYISCDTVCGLHVLTEAENCEAAKSAEARLLLALPKHTSITPAQMCAAEDGWTAIVHEHNKDDDEQCEPGGWWQNGICVGGYTFEKFKIVETYDHDWAHNSLAHELFHVVSLHLWQRDGHCRWYEMGFLDSIKEVTGHWDHTKPGKNCK